MRNSEKDAAEMAAKRQRMMEIGFQLFAERGIEAVTMPEIAEHARVGRTTIFRYFSTKPDLVIAIGAWKWNEYIVSWAASVPQETIDRMTAAEWLRFFLDSFLDLYRNHPDILRFNYSFNSYLRYESDTAEQKQPYMHMVEMLGESFHILYERGKMDGTLNTDIPEEEMFSGIFHIMLAAVTRYAVGLVYVFETADPEKELVRLKEMLLREFTGPC